MKMKHAEPMTFTGKAMKGFAFVAERNVKTAATLKKWINLSLDFVKTLPKK